ncbi:hypothetical protein EV426DRAFT_708414 [Tirmania nivea]|nr:hypothetical protein EV426DRAFT_708414 [Tirmania nivea]
MVKKVFLFEHGLIPAPAVTVGRLITNLRQPNLNYHNPDTDWPVTELPHINFHQLITSDRALKLRGELAKALGGVSTGSIDSRVDIHGKTACQRILDNPREYWEAIRTCEATRNWINKTVTVYNDDIYLIVAIYTVTDPQYKDSSSYVHTLESTGEGALPGTEGLEASIHGKSQGNQQRSFEAVGEMAYAIQCQRLRTKRFRIFRQADAGKIELEKSPQWYHFKRLYLVRPRRGGMFGDDDEISTAAETVIVPDLDDDDYDFVKADADGTEWDKVIIGEEEFFFPNDDERKMALMKMRKEKRRSKL